MSFVVSDSQRDLAKKDHLNNQEAAQYLGLKAATLNKWRVYGEGPPFIKVGRLVRYRRSDLDAYLSGRRVQSTSELSAR